jgi:tRNA(Ile)-lysidine synthase
MFERGDVVLVACSGGPDSVCLLFALRRLRRLFGVRLEVFHFDHALREGSAADAAYVRRLAARLELPFHLRTATERPRRGDSVEMWARSKRLAAAGEVGAEIGATKLALAHTQTDQAETVLMALITGSGDGLAGIPAVNGRAVHPLLDVTRAEVEAFCRALRVRPRLDPTNRDPRYLRNALRLRAIPALERVTGREITTPIARAADVVRLDREALWAEATDIAATLVEPTPRGCRMKADAVLELPRAIGERVVRRAFQTIDAGWTSADVAAVLDLAEGRPGRSRDLTAGLLGERGRVYVSLSSRSSPESRV